MNTFRSEDHLRSILGLIALVVLPTVLALVAAAKAPGVTDTMALEHAQLARQFADGHGFTTIILRPLSLALHPHESPHPDLVSTPIYALLLSQVFVWIEPSGKAVAVLGVGLWLLTAWLVFWIARYWWDWRVAGLATVFCVCNGAGLMSATVGLPQPLLALLVFGAVAVVFPKPGSDGEIASGLAIWQPAVAGLLCGATVLTDYRLLPLALVLGVYLWKTQARRLLVIACFMAGLLLLLAPWWIRNSMVSGRIFGLYWYAALENTREFPGESIWRLTQVPEHPLLYLLMHPWDLSRKLAFGLTQYRLVSMGMLEPVVLVLSAVALFGAPARSSRRRLAWIVVSAGALTVLWSCLTRPDARLLLVWLPLLGCMAAAQLVVWAQANVGAFASRNERLRLSARGMQSLVYAAVVALVGLPMVVQFCRIALSNAADMIAIATAMKQRLPVTGVVLTDVPAFTAWHLNRPALLLSQREADLMELEKQTGPLAGVYLSPSLGALSRKELPDWWWWVISARGVYRGLVPVPNSPVPGLLRVRQETTEPEWLAGLQRTVEQDLQSAEAHAQLAFGYFTLGRLQEAHREFQEATRLDEHDVEAWSGQWQTLAQLRHTDGTLRLAQLVSQASPQDARAKPLLEQAVAHFEQVAAQAPADPWVWQNLIVCRSRLGRWDELEKCRSQLTAILPKSLPPGFLLADLYLQQGMLEKAATECAKLVQERPTMPMAHQLYARVYLAQGSLEDALRECLITVRLRPQWVTAHVMAGDVCLRLKRYDEAGKHMAAALKLAPKLLNLKLRLAAITIAQSATSKAIELYREILATDAKHPVALNNLSELLGTTGQTAEAVTLARQAVSLYPQNPLLRDTAGWAAFQAGHHAEAQLHLREAIRLAPQQGISHFHLAQVLRSQQQNEEARACLQRALECGLPDAEKRAAQAALAPP